VDNCYNMSMAYRCVFIMCFKVYSDIYNRFRKRHLNKQSFMRDTLDYHRRECKHRDILTQQPLEFLIMSDGMTERKGNLPRWLHANKKQKAAVIGNRIIGVEVCCGPIHGIFVYHCDDLIPGGAETMIEVTRQAVSDLRDMLEDLGLTLPKKGCFFFDNCGENKNKLMNAYFTMLVDESYLIEAHVCFLMTGHTHVRIDQIFSIFGNVIYNADFIGSCEGLMALLDTCKVLDDKPPLLQKKIKVTYNLADYLGPYIDKNIMHYQVPHVFKYWKPMGHNKCIMQYKLFPTNKFVYLPKLSDRLELQREQLQREITHIVTPVCPSIGGFDALLSEDFSETETSEIEAAKKLETIFIDAEVKVLTELMEATFTVSDMV
jgi:hypothetical protein